MNPLNRLILGNRLINDLTLIALYGDEFERDHSKRIKKELLFSTKLNVSLIAINIMLFVYNALERGLDMTWWQWAISSLSLVVLAALAAITLWARGRMLQSIARMIHDINHRVIPE